MGFIKVTSLSSGEVLYDSRREILTEESTEYLDQYEGVIEACKRRIRKAWADYRATRSRSKKRRENVRATMRALINARSIREAAVQNEYEEQQEFEINRERK